MKSHGQGSPADLLVSRWNRAIEDGVGRNVAERLVKVRENRNRQIKFVAALFRIALIDVDQRNHSNIQLASRTEPFGTHGSAAD